MCMQAQHCGLPANTPLVEEVKPEVDAGPPKSAMQIAAAKYRRAPAEEATSKAADAEVKPQRPQYPKPKMRDEFLHFSVMPGAAY